MASKGSKSASKQSSSKKSAAKGRARSTRSRSASRAKSGAASSRSRAASRRGRTTTRGRASSTRGEADAIRLLKEDHETVQGLLERLSKAKGSSQREQLLGKITEELQRHTQIEEQIFYPAYRDAVRSADDRQLYYEATEEHHAVDLILPEVQSSDSGSEMFAARAKVLKDLVEHHIEEEERQMFPKARKALGAERLRDLGEELREAKRAAKQPGPLRAIGNLLGARG